MDNPHEEPQYIITEAVETLLAEALEIIQNQVQVIAFRLEAMAASSMVLATIGLSERARDWLLQTIAPMKAPKDPRFWYDLQLWALISNALNQLTASKAYPTVTLQNHLIGVANWVLFWLRTKSSASAVASAALAGQPGATPGPVEMEDPRDRDEPLASW